MQHIYFLKENPWLDHGWQQQMGAMAIRTRRKKKQNSFPSTENSENRKISYTKCPTPDASVIRKAPENLHHILEKEGNKKEKKKGGNEKKF